MDKTDFALLGALVREPRRVSYWIDRPEPFLAPAEVDLLDRGWLRVYRDGEWWFVGVSSLGREEMARHRGRVRKWLLDHLDSLASAFITALITAFVTAWVTAWFTARFEVSRRMPDGVFRNLRGEPDGRGGCHAYDEQPLPASHHTNSVVFPAMQQQLPD